MLSNILLFSVVLAAALIGCQSTRHSMTQQTITPAEIQGAVGGHMKLKVAS